VPSGWKKIVEGDLKKGGKTKKKKKMEVRGRGISTESREQES